MYVFICIALKGLVNPLKVRNKVSLGKERVCRPDFCIWAGSLKIHKEKDECVCGIYGFQKACDLVNNEDV